MRRLRMLVEIERQAGFGPITCLFVVVFLLCSLAVWLADPVANTFGDGMWFSFQAVSTIGFGDVTAAGPVARWATTMAMTTGAATTATVAITTAIPGVHSATRSTNIASTETTGPACAGPGWMDGELRVRYRHCATRRQ